MPPRSVKDDSSTTALIGEECFATGDALGAFAGLGFFEVPRRIRPQGLPLCFDAARGEPMEPMEPFQEKFLQAARGLVAGPQEFLQDPRVELGTVTAARVLVTRVLVTRVLVTRVLVTRVLVTRVLVTRRPSLRRIRAVEYGAVEYVAKLAQNASVRLLEQVDATVNVGISWAPLANGFEFHHLPVNLALKIVLRPDHSFVCVAFSGVPWAPLFRFSLRSPSCCRRATKFRIVAKDPSKPQPKIGGPIALFR
jgi:hypothetical protein